VQVTLRQRAILHIALAALVAAALSHCSWEESRELTRWTQTLAQHRLALPTPVQAPVHDCDHEYGCICRGATLVHAPNATPFKTHVSELLPADFWPLPTCSIVDDSAATWSIAIRRDISLPPISGRQLRALYGSLVI
jgi:hypothetical protein